METEKMGELGGVRQEGNMKGTLGVLNKGL